MAKRSRRRVEETKPSISRRIGQYTGRALKSAYDASHVDKDLSKLGGSIFDTVIGLPVRAVRSAVNSLNYVARAVVGAPEAAAKSLYDKVEHKLEDKLEHAEEKDQPFITLTRRELQDLERLEDPEVFHRIVPHLEAKVADAELREGGVRFSKQQIYALLGDIHDRYRSRLGSYRNVAAILLFALGIFSLDQSKVTGMAVSNINAGSDYYSLFGFLLLGLAVFIFSRKH